VVNKAFLSDLSGYGLAGLRQLAAPCRQLLHVSLSGVGAVSLIFAFASLSTLTFAQLFSDDAQCTAAFRADGGEARILHV